eukprot:CAMPEP_0118985410 /NCGR_PEP_ID=MMETSP1173-20130426/39901_1 /TAXON_ID=1034831 /ORGANISM="Rhizochromulina marina cf, Strain CCMP1243" /LENGTH=40 /DNA_ID= /DNA_START= /DNA_END= /DNA_ORIENTATION=
MKPPSQFNQPLQYAQVDRLVLTAPTVHRRPQDLGDEDENC